MSFKLEVKYINMIIKKFWYLVLFFAFSSHAMENSFDIKQAVIPTLRKHYPQAKEIDNCCFYSSDLGPNNLLYEVRLYKDQDVLEGSNTLHNHSLAHRYIEDTQERNTAQSFIYYKVFMKNEMLECYIESIFTQPLLRSKGYALFHLNSLEAFLKKINCSKVSLTAFVNVVNFYKKRNYQETYEPAPEGLSVMHKLLTT